MLFFHWHLWLRRVRPSHAHLVFHYQFYYAELSRARPTIDLPRPPRHQAGCSDVSRLQPTSNKHSLTLKSILNSRLCRIGKVLPSQGERYRDATIIFNGMIIVWGKILDLQLIYSNSQTYRCVYHMSILIVCFFHVSSLQNVFIGFGLKQIMNIDMKLKVIYKHINMKF